jgi:hypothetical protein
VPPHPSRPARLAPRTATVLGVLLLLALTLVTFGPIVSGRRTVYFGDLGLYFVPQLAFQRRELLAGRLTLWDPYKLCGMPFVGNPQAWPLYPSSLLLGWLDAPVATGVIGVLHLFLAAVGTLLFLRRRGLGLAAALLGALAFGFGGALVSKMQFPNMVQAGAFLPWLLLGVERIVVAGTARPGGALRATAGLGLLIGLALLAAHAQMFLMQFYAGAAWAIFRLRQTPVPNRRRSVSCLLAALALGGALAAGQLLPVADHVRASVRTKMTLGRSNRFTLTPATLATNFVAPNAWGNPATGNYVGPGNFWEPCAFFGVLPFALAVGSAVLGFRKSAEVRSFTLAALLGLWLALGRAGGLYVVAFFVLPGVNKFHDPARWLHVAVFALACLAAFGLDAVLTKALRARGVRAVVALVVLALSAADLLRFDQTLNPTVDARVWGRQTTAALPLGRVLHADVPAAWKRFVSNRTYGPPEKRDEIAANFLATRAPNLPQRAGLLDAGGYEPVRARANNRLLDALKREATAAKNPDAAARHLRAAGVETILTLPPNAPGAVVRRVPGARRAVVFSTWRAARTANEALARFLAPDWDGVPVVANISQKQREQRHREARPGCMESAAGPNELSVFLPPRRANATPVLLVVADTNHAGWRAWVEDADGARLVPIRAANGVFRGVFVASSAPRRVTFRFEPATFRVGLFVSLLAAGIMGGMWASAFACSRARAPLTK